MKKLFFIILLISNTIFAQSNFSVDTSYSIKSTYNKLIKKYPFITFPQEQNNIAISEIKEVIYQKHKDRALHLDAFFYKKQKLNPAIIMIHGGGAGDLEIKFKCTIWLKKLLQKAIRVLLLNIDCH